MDITPKESFRPGEVGVGRIGSNQAKLRSNWHPIRIYLGPIDPILTSYGEGLPSLHIPLADYLTARQTLYQVIRLEVENAYAKLFHLFVNKRG